MRVLVVSPKFHPVVGGGETFVLNSVEKLHEAGETVAIAVKPHPDRVLTKYDFPVHEINGLSDENLDIVQAADGLFQLFDTFKPELIHVHGYFALLAASLANKHATPIVVSVHSTPVWNERIIGGMSGFDQEVLLAKQILKFTKPCAVTGANDVYTKAAEKLTEGQIPVEYLPYPILPDFFAVGSPEHFRNMFQLRKNDVLITLPSRIIERKGIEEAVNALALLPEKYFLCLPCAVKPLDTEYWSRIISSQEYKKISKRLIVPNEDIYHEQMPQLYAASDVVIMPSYYEGAPVATVESLASAKPFVGANSQGINGFIKDRENGLLVEPGSIEPLAEAVATIMKDDELRETITKNAPLSVAHLTWEQQLPRLLNIYKKYSKLRLDEEL